MFYTPAAGVDFAAQLREDRTVGTIDGSALDLGGARPGFWRTVRWVLGGLVGGSVLLWALCVPLSLLNLVGISSGTGMAPYMPWSLDGPWAVAAAIGWGAGVSLLIGDQVCRALVRGTGVRASRWWTALAVAAGGYGGMALGRAGTAQAYWAWWLVSCAVWLVVFSLSGAVRRAPRWLSAVRARWVVLALLVLVAPYALTHPFAASGSGGSDSSGSADGTQLYPLRPGRPIEVDFGLSAARLPFTVTSVSLTGRHLGLLHTAAVTLSGDGDPQSPFAGPGRLHSTRLPLHVPAGRSLWISYAMSLARCGGATITGVRVHYRMLGLSLAQTVRASSGSALFCG